MQAIVVLITIAMLMTTLSLTYANAIHRTSSKIKYMNYTIHRSEDRGHSKLDWLESNHTFSFGDYYNPERKGFGQLRVINEDIVAPGKGFGTHPHSNMEIITIPIEGSVYHKDNMGNEGIIETGKVQIMSAGSGLTHSEYNPSSTEDSHFLQIWIKPDAQNIKPRYETREFTKEKNSAQLLISPDKNSENTIWINQNAYISQLSLEENKDFQYQLFDNENIIYIFVIKGEVNILEQTLNNKDGIGIKDLNQIEVSGIQKSEILILEIPK